MTLASFQFEGSIFQFRSGRAPYHLVTKYNLELRTMMKYLTILAVISIAFKSAAGLSCLACENSDGHHVGCSGDNEKEKECGDHVIGCVEEVGEL